ncbi:MAG: hypothetical protein L0K74_12725 [Acidipropionibacterium acidipropionici]|nr:hypothetical protein [Acidipropionibacterium acidipropionici]
MIIRIMGEGQWDVPDSALSELNSIDGHVEHAVAGGLQEELTDALTRLAATVREHGRQIPDDEILAAPLNVPAPHPPREEGAVLLADSAAGEGLIPG